MLPIIPQRDHASLAEKKNTLDIFICVALKNHGSWKFHSGYFVYVTSFVRKYLIEAKFTKVKFQLGRD